MKFSSDQTKSDSFAPLRQQGKSDATNTAKKVLVVDDEPSILRLFEHLFRYLGWSAKTVVEPQMALSQLEMDPPFDLVILDHHMPVIGGLELSKKIKTIHPDLPIVLVSGRPSPAQRELTEAGIGLFISKPIDLAIVSSALQQMVGGDRPDVT